ncbi:MAG: FliO/MopB family protein [Alphaproteobacteria bacterium]
MDIDYFRFLVALGFVLGLIALAAWLARRFGLGGLMAGQAARASRRTARRLGVVEMAPLDARRRLVLIRRDEVEHLLLLGPDGDRVIESGIRPVAAEPPAAERS